MPITRVGSFNTEAMSSMLRPLVLVQISVSGPPRERDQAPLQLEGSHTPGGVSKAEDRTHSLLNVKENGLLQVHDLWHGLVAKHSRKIMKSKHCCNNINGPR